jgi:hypothetical protein
MNELVLTQHKGKLCRVVVGSKEECTKTLSKYPNYYDSEEVARWLRHYYYEATKKDEVEFEEAKQEHLLYDAMQDVD